MRVHYLQHVPFEGLGSIEPALRQKGHVITLTRLYQGEPLPTLEEIDWLIIMGGPMGIYDEARYPWLEAEKAFIKDAIAAEKTVLGICLGAQLIADALGAKVFKNRHREIGWFPIQRLPEAATTVLAKAIPEQTEAFHWHGDTFEIPQAATPLASSKACKNQAFILHDRVVGFQFHLETTREAAAALIENCRDELDSSPYVQSESEMLADEQRFTHINKVMHAVLEALEARHSPASQ